MTRINQVDQVLMLLRQQLQRMEKAKRRPQAGSAARAGTPSAVRRPAALARIDSLSPEDLEQSLIRALLTEEFGEALASDARFQKVVADVHRIIAADRETRQLLRQAVEQLKQPGTG